MSYEAGPVVSQSNFYDFLRVKLVVYDWVISFSEALRTRGIWKYDRKKDEIWFWDWGKVHPRQRCAQCQLIKRPLPIECEITRGSSEAAFYCSELCAKRDKQRHKQTCDIWTQHGPKQ